MNSNQIVPSNPASSNQLSFTFNGKTLHTLTDENGEFWFYATDVCAQLEIRNVSDAIDRLDEDEKTTIVLSDNGRPIKVLLVSEPGLYSLTGSSRKAEAKTFKRFINHEVVPALRKNGVYVSRPLSTGEMLVANAEAYLRLERQMAEIHEKLGDNALAIERLRDRFDDSEFLSIETWCNAQNIAEGKKSLALRMKWGKQCADISREQGIGFKKALDEPHAPNRYHISILQAVCKPKSGVPKCQLELPEGK